MRSDTPMDTRTGPVPRDPVRTCVGCRGKAARNTLVRVVLDPDRRAAVVDPGRNAPGRGAWLHPSRACLDLARRRRAFPRALRAAGPVDVSSVEAWFVRNDERFIDDNEGGFEADGHPMSTQR